MLSLTRLGLVLPIQLAAVFSMQGVGRVLCGTVLMICAYYIKDTNIQWRIAIVMGVVPMAGALYFRWWVSPWSRKEDPASL